MYFARLRYAAALYRDRDHRAAAIAAIDATLTLIGCFEPGLYENLVAPLASLYSGLKALDVGRVDPLLQPIRKIPGGTLPDSPERLAELFIGVGLGCAVPPVGASFSVASEMLVIGFEVALRDCSGHPAPLLRRQLGNTADEIG